MSLLLQYIHLEVIQKVFSKLNNTESIHIAKRLQQLVVLIAMSQGFTDEYNFNQFVNMLKHDSNKDFNGLLMILFPYFDINQGVQVSSLKEFGTDKINENNVDLPVYRYTNMQYNRCKMQDENIVEHDYSLNDIDQSFYFITRSILKFINGLYVNWRTVRPVLMQNLEKNKYYMNTKENYVNKELFQYNSKEQLGFIEQIQEQLNDNHFYQILQQPDMLSHQRNMQSMQLSQMYDIIVNDFYLSMLRVKWMLYELNEVPLILYLADMMPFTFDMVLNQMPFEKILMYNKKQNEKYITQMKREFHAMVNMKSQWSPQSVVQPIVTLFYYQILYKDNERYQQELDRHETYVETYQFFYQKQQLQFHDLQRYLIKMDFLIIYEYLFSVIYQLRNGNSIWYHHQLFDKSTNRYFHPSQYSFTQQNEGITLKNVYNVSKSMMIAKSDDDNQKKQLKFLPRYFDQMTSEQQKTVRKRFDYTQNTWFNIDKQLQITSSNLTSNDVHEHIMQNMFPRILFEFLIYSGQLTELELDTQWLVKDDNSIQDLIQGSYYFLTNDVYNREWLVKIRDTIDRPWSWFNFYSMNWVIQLRFFNNFLSNRIMYVTGSTGAGKSTQVPKLLLYGTKVVYHKIGKVVCTQPRIQPTQQNAESIADSMGVPIRDLDENQDFVGHVKRLSLNQSKVKTEQRITLFPYYLQYQHSQQKHISSLYGYQLLFITDASLLQMMNYFNKVTKKDSQFTHENQYDIIIVDEAHEHSVNIDNIVSQMRHTALYNNECKFIITSATMQSDEPIYRRFFRIIDDFNIHFGNTWTKTNQLSIHNVDRRFDISARVPYTVKDYFRPGNTFINVISEIQRKEALQGDIILFQPTERLIKEAVKQLNNSSSVPPHAIALPYYKNTSSDYKEFIYGIHENKFRISVSKQQMNEIVDDNPTVELITQDNKKVNKYSIIILVATNIAEASITIPTLKYVIDNGQQNRMIYDHQNDYSYMEVQYIQETNRLQRRGRVGRTSNGSAYYLYDQKDTQGQQQKQQIINDDIRYNVLLHFLRMSDKKFNYNEFFDAQKTFLNPLISQIKKDYETEKYDNVIQVYDQGLSEDQIIDQEGIFHVIHPMENGLKRNMLNQITERTYDIQNDKSKVLFKYLHQDGFTDSQQSKNNISKVIQEIDRNSFQQFFYAKMIYYCLLIDPTKVHDILLIISVMITTNGYPSQLIDYRKLRTFKNTIKAQSELIFAIELIKKHLMYINVLLQIDLQKIKINNQTIKKLLRDLKFQQYCENNSLNGESFLNTIKTFQNNRSIITDEVKQIVKESINDIKHHKKRSMVLKDPLKSIIVNTFNSNLVQWNNDSSGFVNLKNEKSMGQINYNRSLFNKNILQNRFQIVCYSSSMNNMYSSLFLIDRSDINLILH